MINLKNKHRVNFNIDKDLHYKVKKLALELDTTATKLYVQWTIEGLEREKQKKAKR